MRNVTFFHLYCQDNRYSLYKSIARRQVEITIKVEPQCFLYTCNLILYIDLKDIKDQALWTTAKYFRVSYTGCPKKNGTCINNYLCIKNEIRV